MQRRQTYWQSGSKLVFICLIFCCIFFTNRIDAQQYNFRNYSVAEGLAQSQVYAMCQDRRGTLWLGTNGGGVSVFDGINFNTLSEDDGLLSNYVNAILEDASGHIWFGTEEGLSMYDGKHFKSYTSKDGLCGNHITCLMIDHKGILWIGSNGSGLSKMIGGKFFNETKKRDGLISNNINSIIETRNHETWIGTSDGAMHININGNREKLTSRNGLPSNDIRHIMEDHTGTIWLATYTGGICKYDGYNFKNYTEKDGLSSEKVSYVLEDKHNNIWIATYDAGACRYDGAKFTVFKESEGLCNDALHCMLQDNQGNIWFGSSAGGISRFDSERFIHFTGNGDKMGNLVYAIHEDHQHRMWFASSIGGVTRYDSLKYTTFKKEQGFTNYKVRCIYEDQGGRQWFGTIGDGAFVYDGHNFTHIGSKNGLSGNFINDITSDKFDNIWFATAGGGVCYARSMDIDSGKIIPFVKYGPKNGLVSERILSLMADTAGNMWLGTNGGGLAKISHIGDSLFSVAKYQVRATGGTHIVRTVTMDQRNNIWVGTGGDGIAWFDGANFHPITKKEGLSSNNIYLMTFDKTGNLWVGTEKGVDKIVFKAESGIKNIYHYGRPEGFTGIETMQNAVCTDHKGNLWFGTVNGTTVYKPEEDRPDEQSPKLYLTGIKLFFDKIEDTPYGQNFSPWYAIPKNLILPYHKNQLSFEFSGINLRNPENVKYKWILEGFDKTWTPPNSNRTATYNNLPPGTYIFLVKSANEDGVWNENPVSFTFIITPPYWETLWFRIAGIAFVILVVYFIFYLRIKAIRRRNQAEKDKLELEKNIVELEQQALLLQMNPHFIFNSLNSIQAYISKNDSFSAKKYLAKFAKLMRQILENSTESFIPLSEEISMIRNYLDLERLCHNDKFEYTIVTDPGIGPEQISIPPMLIQPFLENAVLHGIVPATEPGHIEIFFGKAEIKDQLICRITDNGVGINHALKSKNEDPTDHKSMAYQVTEKRLDMMQVSGSKKPSVQVTDRNTLNSEIHGTEVSLRMPFLD